MSSKRKEKFNNLLSTLNNIENVDYNWKVINKSSIILNDIFNNELKLPEVFPIPNGCIQFEWENDRNDYLEFEISENNIELYFQKKSYAFPQVDKTLNIEEKDIFSVLDNFMNYRKVV